MDGRHYKNPPPVGWIFREPERADRMARFTEAYQAYRNGKRKCPSRHEFGIREVDAEAIKTAITKAEGNT
jgi:hypothetical protein